MPETETLPQAQTNFTFAEELLESCWKQGEPEITSGIDWIRFELTTNQAGLEFLKELLFKDCPKWENHDAKIRRHRADNVGYSHVLQGEFTESICYNFDEETDCYEIAVKLPGSYLATKTFLSTIFLLYTLHKKFILNCTRLDFFVDDRKCDLQFTKIFEAVNLHNYGGCHSVTPIIDNAFGQVTGWTFNLGSRNSESYTRIYHKYEKHQDKAIRVEAEIKGVKCKVLFFDLMRKVEEFCQELEINNQDDLEEFYYQIVPFSQSQIDEDLNLSVFNIMLAEFVACVAVGQITFIDRSKTYDNGFIASSPKLFWWENFLKKVGEQLKIRVDVHKPSLQKKHNWVARQVSRFLCILEDGLGYDGLHRYIDNQVYARREGIDPQTGEKTGAPIKYSDYEDFLIEVLQAKGIDAFYLAQDHEEEIKKYWLQTEGEFPELFANHRVASYVCHKVNPLQKQKEDLLFAVEACYCEDLLCDYFNFAKKLGFEDVCEIINYKLVNLVE